MARLPGGRALVAALAAHEVDVVFGIPGTHNLPIYAHLDAYGIGHVTPRHEQGAGYAADGYARVTGAPGVVLTTTGPALLNAAGAAAQSYADSVPVLLISPGPPTDHSAVGDGHGRALDALTGGSERVRSVEDIPAAVARAFAAMATGRPRPRHLEIPRDLLDKVGDVEIVPPVPVPTPRPDVTEVHRATELLAYALRPGIIAGGGARGAHRELLALAERLDAPVLTTSAGKGVLAEDHPLALGAGLHLPAAAAFVKDCDVVLAVGTELAPADLWHGPLEFSEVLVRIDVDAAQVNRNATPRLAVVGDAGVTLRAVVDALGPKPRRRRRHAVEQPEDRSADWRARIDAEAHAEGRPWLPLLDVVDAVLGRDGIFAGDSAMACSYGAIANLPRYLPRTFLHPTGPGTGGYGLPAAIGALVGWPHARAVALHGDGGFMLVAPELATAAQLGLPLPVVVVDNGGYGQVRAEMRARGDSEIGVDLAPVDFRALAGSLGCHGMRTDDPDALVTAFEAAFAADRPTLIHVEERIYG